MATRRRNADHSGVYRLLTVAGSIIFVFVFGCAGYMIIEGWSLLDAAYMTSTTITTVGFREVQPLSDAGRIFTMVLILGGVSVFFYGFVNIVAFVVEGELGNLLGTKRMRGKIESLQDHFILCGFGRVGQEIARELDERRAPFVVIDADPDAIEHARGEGYLAVEGDATNDETLVAAGLERARCLLAAADSDAGNTFMVLAARGLRPDIFVVTRASLPDSEPRMIQAGAGRVISPYLMAGRHMALSALQPMLVDFVDALETRKGDQLLAEIEIKPDHSDTHRIADIVNEKSSITVLALQKATGETIVGPRLDTAVTGGDWLIVLAGEADLADISEAHARPGASR
ncbi:MAG TPA: potassium channel family protein [Dehalococcoidia bacterium]|nr:potassium channel family protein [Dehalococcoidia bacterium]